MATEKWLIDAKALMDEFRKCLAERHDRERCISEENCNTCERECLWRRVVKKVPSVDAVEVVRCKDCKHHEHYDALLYCGHTRGLAGSVSPDGFCSYGERRTDET